MPEEDDELDGCDIDFAEHADDEETAELRPLFPDGDPAKAEEWRQVLAAHPSAGGPDA